MSKCDNCAVFICSMESMARTAEIGVCIAYKPKEPKPTRYDRIRQDMTIEKMAEMRVSWNNDPNHYMGGYYMCNGASGIYKTQQNAIAAEIEYLKGVE